MFGRKSRADHPGAIAIAQVNPNLPADAFELARFWVTSDRSFVAIGFQDKWSPELLGSLLVEGLHTAAVAYSQAVGIAEDEAFCLLWQGVDDERARLATEAH